MFVSKQHPIDKLNEYKRKLSELLLNVQSRYRLYKEKIDDLYNAITEPDLVNLGIKINESRKEILKGILDDLNDSTREWHYKVNSDEFQFVVDLIRDVEIQILQKMQEAVQNRKETLELGRGGRLFACITDQEDYQEIRKLKSKLRELKVEKRKIELEPKVQEWKIKLDQKFKESKHKQLDIIAEEINSKYISKLIDNNNQYNLKGHYITLEEVLNRANPTYEDKKILLKWDIYQVRILLKDKDKKLTKADKEALNEILKDLQKEKNKSKEDFDPQNDGYIQNLRETRDKYVENARKIVSAIPQSTVETARVSHQPVVRQL